MTAHYTHLDLNEDVLAPSGYYTPVGELRLSLDGREVLCIRNQTVIESSCCGIADFCSTTVPGFIIDWHSGNDNAGHPVTEVEPVTDEAVKDRIREHLRTSDCITEIEFW